MDIKSDGLAFTESSSSGNVNAATFVAVALLLLLAAAQSMILAIILIICCLGIAICLSITNTVLSSSEGSVEMQSISEAIREGSASFFRRVYGTTAFLSLPMAILIFFVYASRTPSAEFSKIDKNGYAFMIALSFIAGCFCSGVAGFIGLWVSVRANVRVAASASSTYRGTIQLALKSGAVPALVVVTLVIIGVSVLFIIFDMLYGGEGGIKFARIPMMLVGYSFGASFVALFAQLGGGIFTKAADVGADLVGKQEKDIPEDDPRNPAVIADLVGDNVGDCSARGADLFESIAAEIISAMILGGTLATQCKLSREETEGFVLFPLMVHAFDIIVSSIGIFSISGRDSPGLMEDPMTILKRGYSVALVCAFIGFVFSTRWLLYTEKAPDAWWHFTICGVIGMATAYFSLLITQYYTDSYYRPVKSIAEASLSGHATNVIAGLAVGMESTMPAILIVSVSLLSSYWIGTNSGLKSVEGVPVGGLFGTAVATMGMLSCAVYVISIDVLGPICDNAGGIAEMSHQPPSVREITDRLDAVGNTTKACTKGYAVGSAILACFLLFTAYLDEVSALSGEPFIRIDIAIPEVFVSGLLGGALVYSFASMAMQAVGSTAQDVVIEVRRQFNEIPGLMTGDAKPDYSKCVDIIAKASLKKMVQPGLLVVVFPVINGIVFRYVGSQTAQPYLGGQCVGSFLMFATVSGVLMALFLNNAGGAWDNTKKLIETGAHGGKGSDAHKAAVTGDTVGDPSKDTAGPSLHILIKCLSTTVVVLCPLFLNVKQA